MDEDWMVKEVHPIEVVVNPDPVLIPGEGGAPVLRLTYVESIALQARSMLTYMSLIVYWVSIVVVSITLHDSIGYMLETMMLFAAVATGFVMVCDVRFLLLRNRQAGVDFPSISETYMIELFPSPAFVLYYARRRGDGFSVHSREPIILHVAFYAAISDLPQALLLSLVLSSIAMPLQTFPGFAFVFAISNCLSGCALVPFAFSEPPVNDAEAMLHSDEGEGGVKLDARELQVRRLMRLHARDNRLEQEHYQQHRQRILLEQTKMIHLAEG